VTKRAQRKKLMSLEKKSKEKKTKVKQRRCAARRICAGPAAPASLGRATWAAAGTEWRRKRRKRESARA
jgi:hypothetical protein